MEQLVQNPVYNLVKILNEGGLQVLYIDKEYFSVTEFYPADRNTPYHKLVGKHITKIIYDYMNTGLQQQQLVAALQKVETMPERDLQFSEHYSWKWMLR